MTPQAQRIAIAELLGWKWYRQPASVSWPDNPRRALYHPELHRELVATLQPADMTERQCNAEFLWREGMVPDFPGELNAMHDAEQILNNDQCQLFAELLVDLNNGDPLRVGWEYRYWAAAHATAALRAECLLKATGKWTE